MPRGVFKVGPMESLFGTTLPLKLHLGKMLTEEEVLLSQVFERRAEVKRAADAETNTERKILSSSGTAAAINRPSIVSAAYIAKSSASARGNDDDEYGGGGEAGQPESLLITSHPATLPTTGEGVAAAQDKKKTKKRPAEEVADELASGGGGSGMESEDGEAIRNDFAYVEPVTTGQAKKTSTGVLKKMRRTSTTNTSGDACADEEDDEVVVDMDTLDANALYASGYLSHETWDPELAATPKTHVLPNFGMISSDAAAQAQNRDTGAHAHKNNTLVLQVSIPDNANRWSVNICPEEHHGAHVLLHFNPRYKPGKLVLNNKEGTWGHGTSVRIDKRSGNRGTGALRSRDIEVLISIRDTGFAIFANKQSVAFFPHRSDISTLDTLAAVLCRTDDNGVLESVKFHKVWWGYRDPSLDEVPASVMTHMLVEQVEAFQEKIREDRRLAQSPTAEERAANAKAIAAGSKTARMLQITGLPVHDNDVDTLELEKLLYAVFEEFLPEDVHVNLGTNSGYLVLPSVEACLNALDELQGVGFEGADGAEYFLDIKRFKKAI